VSPYKRFLRGVIHCHSKYSYDSMTDISSYLKAAKKSELDFVILTDHDNVEGARRLRAEAARTMPALEVPLAAEYLTDQGDVIAAFLTEEVRSRSFPQFVEEARRREALLFLPHPYVGHKAPEEIGPQCDLIEVFNCRTSESKNARAADLAKRLDKRAFAGSDAHFAWSISSAVVEVENLGSLRTSMLNGEIKWASPRQTHRSEYGASQLIKAWKRRDARLAARLMRSGFARILRRKPSEVNSRTI